MLSCGRINSLLLCRALKRPKRHHDNWETGALLSSLWQPPSLSGALVLKGRAVVYGLGGEEKSSPLPDTELVVPSLVKDSHGVTY